MNRDEILWLVKTGGRVLGPMKRAQVYDLLKSKEINYLDEVSSPMRRWQSLQNHPEFRDMVEKLRQALSEKTQNDWTPTDHGGLTQTATDISSGELTDEITSDLDGFTPTGKEIIVHELKEQTAGNGGAGTSGRFQPKGFSPAGMQTRVENTTRWLWIVVVLVLLAAGWMVMQQRSHFQPSLTLTGDQLKKQVLDYIQIGAYSDALKLLRSTDSSQSGDLAFYYGTLLIQVEGQTVLGRRLLAPIASSSRNEAKLALTSLGVADIIDGQFDSADSNFARALTFDSDYEAAQINKVLVLNAKGKVNEARNLAAALVRGGTVEGIAYLALAETSERLLNSERGATHNLEVVKQLRNYRTRYWDYDAEINLHALYLETGHGTRVNEDRLTEFLDRDPRLTDNHRHNVFIYRGNANWQRLAKLCNSVIGNATATAKQNTFLGSCAYRAGRFAEAKAFLEKAVHQDPKDAQIQAWYSLVLGQTGQADQASVVLGRANEFNRHGEYRLPILLQARFCQQMGDIDCARENWQRIYEKNLEDINAIAGLATVHVANKAFGEAKKLIDSGLRISPDFIPLLKLQQQRVKEGW